VLPLVPEPGRYLLYGAITCPFTHRVLLARARRSLGEILPMALARPVPGPAGWEFDPPGGRHADPLGGAASLRDIYAAADPAFSGKASVPLLWDRTEGSVVSQDSHAIALALNAHPGGSGPDLYPGAASRRIDEDVASFDRDFVRSIIIAGSTQSQADYAAAVAEVFRWLDALEKRLARCRYLGGSAPDLSDLVVFTGLVRFDTCYYFGSRCHLRRIQDYPALWGYTRDIYQLPGVAATVDLDAFRESYFLTRPNGRNSVIPIVPVPDFSAAHDRAG
jgi:putative glutathione S-transferase